MNRAKRMEYAIALGEILGWLRGRYAAELQQEASPERPSPRAVKTLEDLLAELRVYPRRI